MHSHILPGLDDGSKSMEETMQVLREAKGQRISHIIVTPHFHPGRYVANAVQILTVLGQVQKRCRMEHMDITLYPGQECFYYSNLVKHLNDGRVLTLANSRYVLVEFEPDASFSYLLKGVRDLQASGYRPILAHFERYDCLNNEAKLDMLKQQKVLLQMNFDMLLIKKGIFHRPPWRSYLEKGYVDYLGSDCHGMNFRPLHVQEACGWMEKHLDEKLRVQITETNVQKIIRNE